MKATTGWPKVAASTQHSTSKSDDTDGVFWPALFWGSVFLVWPLFLVRWWLEGMGGWAWAPASVAEAVWVGLLAFLIGCFLGGRPSGWGWRIRRAERAKARKDDRRRAHAHAREQAYAEQYARYGSPPRPKTIEPWVGVPPTGQVRSSEVGGARIELHLPGLPAPQRGVGQQSRSAEAAPPARGVPVRPVGEDRPWSDLIDPRSTRAGGPHPV